MRKIAAFIGVILVSLSTYLAVAQKTNEEQIDDQVQEAIEEAEKIEKDLPYRNPREVLLYDETLTTPLALDKNSLQKIKADNDFDYTTSSPEENPWTRFKKWLSNLWNSFISWILGGSEAVGSLAILIRLLPYIGIVILVGLLVWIFMKIDSGTLLNERKALGGVLLSDDEELIKNQDLQQLMDEALVAKNYRLAIRYYYLLILQKMSLQERIDWQVQKTNHDYIFEIEDQEIQTQFRKVTDLYDYIWYGNFEVDESAFAKAESPFNTLKQQL